MSKLGTYRNKNVYDYGSLTTAKSASIDNDIFSVYWIDGSWGKMFWKGKEIACVQLDEKGLIAVINLDEELWSSKAPVRPTYSMKKKEAPMEGPLYDVDWYKKVMGELAQQWSKLVRKE